ncbi:hypothetical protein D3C80_988100 [compost metagenome]
MSVTIEHLSGQDEELWSVCFGSRRIQFRNEQGGEGLCSHTERKDRRTAYLSANSPCLSHPGSLINTELDFSSIGEPRRLTNEEQNAKPLDERHPRQLRTHQAVGHSLTLADQVFITLEAGVPRWQN